MNSIPSCVLKCTYMIILGWLEPLLDEINKDKTIVVTPVIDVIDDSTLEFHYGSAKHTSVGGFDWNLQFNWHSIPDRENKRRKDEVDFSFQYCCFTVNVSCGI